MLPPLGEGAEAGEGRRIVPMSAGPGSLWSRSVPSRLPQVEVSLQTFNQHVLVRILKYYSLVFKYLHL